MRLEDAAAEARVILSQRRKVLDDVNTIAAYAQDMNGFLQESEMTERRAFIESVVKEIIVMPGDALMRYTVPMPDDNLIPGKATETVTLPESVLSTWHDGAAGQTGVRWSGGICSGLRLGWFLHDRPFGKTPTRSAKRKQASLPLADARST